MLPWEVGWWVSWPHTTGSSCCRRRAASTLCFAPGSEGAVCCTLSTWTLVLRGGEAQRSAPTPRVTQPPRLVPTGPSCPDGAGVWANALGAWSCLITQEDFSRTPCNSRSVSSGSRQAGFPSNSYQSQRAGQVQGLRSSAGLRNSG